jgi:hypothetical protein
VAAAILFTGALSGLASAASLTVYPSAAGEQSTYVIGAATETFDTLSSANQSAPYLSAIATYQFNQSSQFAVLAADQYVGANAPAMPATALPEPAVSLLTGLGMIGLAFGLRLRGKD